MKNEEKFYKSTFHKRLKKAREDVGYTQQQVCDMLNITQTALSRYENGNREPNVEMLGKMAEIYDISIDWLYGLGKQNIENPKYDKYLNEMDKSIKRETAAERKRMAK